VKEGREEDPKGLVVAAYRDPVGGAGRAKDQEAPRETQAQAETQFYEDGKGARKKKGQTQRGRRESGIGEAGRGSNVAGSDKKVRGLWH
jgi:hypothetical protein